MKFESITYQWMVFKMNPVSLFYVKPFFFIFKKKRVIVIYYNYMAPSLVLTCLRMQSLCNEKKEKKKQRKA